MKYEIPIMEVIYLGEDSMISTLASTTGGQGGQITFPNPEEEDIFD